MLLSIIDGTAKQKINKEIEALNITTSPAGKRAPDLQGRRVGGGPAPAHDIPGSLLHQTADPPCQSSWARKHATN